MDTQGNMSSGDVDIGDHVTTVLLVKENINHAIQALTKRDVSQIMNSVFMNKRAIVTKILADL